MKQRIFGVAWLIAAAVFAWPAQAQQNWNSDPIWYDGLVEKAVYDAKRVIYGHARSYEAILFTNKEQHDLATLTKADKSANTVEVFKHNHIEVVPTPNYDYKFITTTHLQTDNLTLTRLDATSQEFCGTSFKQYLRTADGSWEYFAFSYFPEEGRRSAQIPQDGLPVVPEDALPLFGRNFPFDDPKDQPIALLPTQKSNKHVAHTPLSATLRYAGNEGDTHKVDLVVDGKIRGTYWFAKDRQHVMTRYEGADGTSYALKSLDRVDYWTRHE